MADLEVAPGPEGEGTLEGLAAARSHLAAVAQELAALQQPFVAGSENGFDFRAVGKLVRHLEVDRDEARARADRLNEERATLLEAQARLEAELRTTRKDLGEARRQLQHRDLDLRMQAGADGVAPVIEPPSTSPPSFEAEALCALCSQALCGTGMGRKVTSMSKPQLKASFLTMQAELEEERKRRDKIQKAFRKERRRLEGLVALVEKQRDELQALRSVEEALPLGDNTGEEEGFEDEDEDDADGTSNVTPTADTSPFGGSRGGSRRVGNGDSRVDSRASSRSGLSRQQSAPTKLPNVVR